MPKREAVKKLIFIATRQAHKSSSKKLSLAFHEPTEASGGGSELLGFEQLIKFINTSWICLLCRKFACMTCQQFETFKLELAAPSKAFVTNQRV
jgi:hypothetical protein